MAFIIIFGGAFVAALIALIVAETTPGAENVVLFGRCVIGGFVAFFVALWVTRK